MSYFSRVAKEVRPPPATLVLPPTAFMPNWPDAPKGDVCVGITMLSESDITTAKQAASTEAWRLYPREEDVVLRLAAANDLVMRWIVATGTCDPNNVAMPFELWRMGAEDVVKEALTGEGCRAIFDAIERVGIELSPLIAEADDDDIETVALFASVALDLMPESKARRIRRLFTYCLEELMPYVPDAPRDEPAPTP